LSKSHVQIAWVDCNHGYPDSLDPMKDMAQGMLLDAQADDAALLKKITDATDAICVHADLTPESKKLLDGLKPFLAKRLHGIGFEPAEGFFDDNLQPGSDASRLRKRYCGFPVDLPDLAALQPPQGNTRPDGIAASCLEQYRRGELPEYY
jgi:hypothetical protein